jgi:hypothetical protein
MIATCSRGILSPMRRFAAIGFAAVIAACGGGSTPTPDPSSGSTSGRSSTPNSERKRALAVALGIPYYTVTDLNPLIAPYSNGCRLPAAQRRSRTTQVASARSGQTHATA